MRFRLRSYFTLKTYSAKPSKPSASEGESALTAGFVVATALCRRAVSIKLGDVRTCMGLHSSAVLPTSESLKGARANSHATGP